MFFKKNKKINSCIKNHEEKLHEEKEIALEINNKDFQLYDIVLNKYGHIGFIIDITEEDFVVNFMASSPFYHGYICNGNNFTNCLTYNKKRTDLLHKISLNNFNWGECLNKTILEQIQDQLKKLSILQNQKLENFIVLFNYIENDSNINYKTNSNKEYVVCGYDNNSEAFISFKTQFNNFQAKDCSTALDLLKQEIKCSELLQKEQKEQKQQKEQENIIKKKIYNNFHNKDVCDENNHDENNHDVINQIETNIDDSNIYSVKDYKHLDSCLFGFFNQETLSNSSIQDKDNNYNDDLSSKFSSDSNNLLKAIKDVIELKKSTKSDFERLTANRENECDNKNIKQSNKQNNKHCFKKGDKVKIKDWNRIYPDYENWQGFENDAQLKEIWSGKFNSTLSALKYFPNKNKTYIIKKIKQHNRTYKDLAFIVDEYCNISDYYDMDQILEEYKNKNDKSDSVKDNVSDNVNDWMKKYNLSMLKPEFKTDENGKSYLNFTLCTPLGWIIDVDSLEKVEE